MSFDGKRRLPFHEQADGSLVCRHRDTCVCPKCAAEYDDELTEVFGVHYAITKGAATDTLGIPYASAEIRDGVMGRVCPECDDFIPEPTDADGEATRNTYGEHWEDVHA